MKIPFFRGEYAFLSNFALVGGTSVEHLYQAEKAMTPENRSLILSARTPGESKKLARTIPLRPDWEQVKVSVMLELLRWKFGQEPFRSLLLNTGEAYLEEGNWWRDYFWGVCEGTGQNMLGKLLMHVRGELQPKTRVVNISYNFTYDVYIGRAGHGHDGYFGNPFRLDDDVSREEVLRQYEVWFYNRLDTDPEFKRRIHALKGKVLGCFCAPKLCHGHIIIDYLNNAKELQSLYLQLHGTGF